MGTTGYTGYPHLIKREADSEAEADPLTVVSPYTGLYGNVYGAGVLNTHHMVNPVTYTYGLHTPLTTGYTGYPHLIKRQTDLEAVAEPRLIKREAEADPLTVVSPYTGLYGNVHGAGVYGAHHLVNPVTYTVPTVNTVARTVVPTVAAKTVIAAPSIYRPVNTFAGLYY